MGIFGETFEESQLSHGFVRSKAHALSCDINCGQRHSPGPRKSRQLSSTRRHVQYVVNKKDPDDQRSLKFIFKKEPVQRPHELFSINECPQPDTQKQEANSQSTENLRTELTAGHGNPNASFTHTDEGSNDIRPQGANPCPHCPRAYASLKWLHRHISHVHQNCCHQLIINNKSPKRRLFRRVRTVNPCPHCSRSYASRKWLYSHICRVHQNGCQVGSNQIIFKADGASVEETIAKAA